MRKYLIIVACALVIVVLSGRMSAAQNFNGSQDNLKLDDGFYLIRNQGSKISDFDKRTGEERVVTALPSKNATGDTPQVLYLVGRTPEIPLELSAKPQIVGDSPDERRLTVQLADKLKADLLKFTTDHLEQRVALVLDKRVVMNATIRSPIADGRFEISTGDDELSRLQHALNRKFTAKESPKSKASGKCLPPGQPSHHQRHRRSNTCQRAHRAPGTACFQQALAGK